VLEAKFQHRMKETMCVEIVALAGGVGAARFLSGLAEVMDPQRITIIGNTGDDMEWNGFSISPDLDTVAYTLAGLSDEVRGWGRRDETYHCLDGMSRYGMESWFKLGDRDLATHCFRTMLLRQGVALSEVTRRICQALGVRSRLLPATDDRLRTRVDTNEGWLDFQDYFVRRGCQPEVHGIAIDGAENARPAPGVLEAIAEATAVIVCPSNPLISIGPILAVPGIREALRARAGSVAAISPIVGGRALKGPADRMMRGIGLRPAASAVAELYRDFVGVFVLDNVDDAEQPQVEALGMKAAATATIMTDQAARVNLARAVLEQLNLGEVQGK
jgi:LPPG:FO 2-phospho-L-lactate transferase